MGGQVPVLWITGPSGVGKSAVSWQMFTEMAQAGRVAFADADQFCMCYPAPHADPTRERMKARNIGALVPRYRGAGAQCVIVNGCLDPHAGLLAELMPQAAVTICRLRADRDELARRFTGRHRAPGDAGELLREALDDADALDASTFADACVDTTAMAVHEVASLVRDSCRDWPGFSAPFQNARSAPDAQVRRVSETGGHDGDDDARRPGGQVLLICGPAGVGKSAVGFELYLRYLRGGRMAGYVDLDQIGFVCPAPDGDPGRHLLKAGNAAAIWRTYHAAGATHLIMTGPVDSESALQAYLRALPAGVAVCRLHAGPAELSRRIMSRGGGGSWDQPGDPLRGQPAEYLLRAAGQAIESAAALERAGFGTIRVDTDLFSVVEAADLIAAMTS